MNNVQYFRFMPRRKGQVDQDKIRRQLLEAAEALIVAEGPAGLTARRLALAVGYSLGHIYNLFPDLNHLLLTVNGRTLDRLHAALAEAAGADRLEALALGYLRFTAENAALWQQVLTHRLTPAGQLPDSYREKVKALPRLVMDILRELAPARDEALLRADVALLWSSLHGLGTLALSHRLELIDSPPVEELARNLLRQYRASL